MRIACILMQKNEGPLLRSWVAYHGSLIGFENLYIADNGSEDSYTREVLNEGERKGVNVDYSRNTGDDFKNKGFIFSNWILNLRLRGQDYDFYFPLDCDEFLSATNRDGIPKFGLANVTTALEEIENDFGAIYARSVFNSNPVYRDYYQHVSHGDPGFLKLFLPRNSHSILDSGYHRIEMGSSSTQFSRISYAHFHYRRYEEYVQFSKQKLLFSVNSFDEEFLLKYKGTSSHVVEGMVASRVDYYKKFSKQGCLHLPEILRVIHQAEEEFQPDSDGANLGIDSLFARPEEVAEARAAPRGYVDEVEIQPGRIRFSGWAVMRDGAIVDGFIVKINGKALRVKEFSRIDRQDVVQSGQTGEADCGFEFFINFGDVPAEPSSLRMYACDAEEELVGDIVVQNADLIDWSAVSKYRDNPGKYRNSCTVTDARRQADALYQAGVEPPVTLPSEVAEYLREQYTNSSVVLEYGSGGTTIIAAKTPRLTCFSVENDRKWADHMSSWVAEYCPDGSTRVHLADTGDTNEWGYPSSPSVRESWKYFQYPRSVWRRTDYVHPDLVFVDGRFRIACFLTVLSKIRRPTKLLFDDYQDRPQYRIVEKIVAPTRFVGRMAVFDLEPGMLTIMDRIRLLRQLFVPG